MQSKKAHVARRMAALLLGSACTTVMAVVPAAVSQAAPASYMAASARSHVLNLPFTADTQPPDPDVFYADQGLEITTSVYEGLVQYATNTPYHKIVADLATSWKISPDGKTYTFDLRHGVHFHDGTLMTSAAVKASFARRLAVNQAPAYMLADLASVSTPSPYVAVVHLKTPNSAFMDYLASAYGPKILSPTALSAHAGTDHDQTWLKTHDAGTGPYTITSAQPGQKYVLSAYKGYWGAKPWYTTVNISIIPDTSTQQLELQQGQLTAVLNDFLPAPAIASLRKNPAFHVVEVPTLQMPMVWVNPNYGVFSTIAMRRGLAEAINRKTVVQDVFPGRATLSTQIYPQGIEPAGTARFVPRYNPGVLTQAVAKLSSKKVELAYQADDPNSAQMADLIQADLAATGLQVSVVAVPQATIYSWPGSKSKSLPDLLVEVNWPDAYNPDTWARIAMTPGGGLNYLNCDVPAGTRLLDAGLAATNQATVATDYQKAGDAFAASGCWLPMANLEGTMVLPKWMGGVDYQTAVPHTIVIADLRPTR
ncbi:MAG TPA: ABC transporter substrate-binding protein [Acidimicrobiales bacterium]|nr:ABC transporter substrate-binding protein [Acidimicrobiales bacterium]